ncbi:MAG: hypothetical protein ABIG44_05495 [Planctomycetota bacterium]
MPRAGKECAVCARVFAAGADFWAALYEIGEGYIRRDFCPLCAWPIERRPVGFWKTHRPVPTPKRSQPFDRQALYEFFRRLEHVNEPARQRLRFVLALLLWRKKVLKFERSTTTNEQEYWDFTTAGADDRHRVPRPDLDEEQLEQLSAQLEQLCADLAHSPTDDALAREEQTDG